MKKVSKVIKNAGAGIALSACFCFFICLYAPLELYLTNISEFWMSVGDMFLFTLPAFAVCFVLSSVCFIIASVINEKFYKFCLAAVSSITVSTLIQGTFLVKNLPAMDGTTVEWGAPEYRVQRILSIAVYAVPLIALVIIFLKLDIKKVKSAVSVASVCLIVYFTINATAVGLTTDVKKNYSLTSSVKNEFLLSDDDNLVVLILDATDARYFKRAMDSDKELSGMLDGFTYYDNALANYAFTKTSYPTIFSGEVYRNEGNFQEYRTNAFLNSKFLNRLWSDNYAVGFYEEDDLGFTKDLFGNKFDNFCNRKTSNNLYGNTSLILRMAMVKNAPWDLKRFGWDVEKRARDCCTTTEGYGKFNWSNTDFYNQLKESNPITKTDKKCARIIHIEGAHVPLRYDKELNIVEHGTYEGNVDACVTIVKQYITRLKESGVYDNSKIVIMADHGWSGTHSTDNVNPHKRLNPILIVKGRNEKHELQYSSAPISYTDLTDAFVKLIDGNTGDNIFEYKDGDKRTRTMYVYNYGCEKEMHEYTTDSTAYDYDAMKDTGILYKAEE